MDVAQVIQGKASTSFANNLANHISDFLLAETDGPLTFGAQNEPLWRSQIEAMEAICSYLRQGETLGHIVQVGGSGKTREAILLSMLAHQDGAKSLFIVPTQQAVIDFSNRAKLLCPELEIGSVYSDSKTLGDLTFITYASVLRLTLGKQVKEEADEFQKKFDDEQEVVSERTKIDPDKYSLVHWDESHWYITPSATKLLEQFSHAVNIGYTATPRYYSGKEVSDVFGECIYELEFDVARERKEIATYSNILLRSNIETNLSHLHPMFECSEEVAQVINTTERNLIFPDFYKNAEITVRDTKYSLLGEAAIVFGTTISHVHHLADVFNHSLMPHLKTDSSFRQRLQEKGIDPDKVEKIAEPIHSGGNEYYSKMSASEREALIDKYEQRKILCLVSTSLLQQSFDSKKTSVVIDTVPRQTYVGVGQAGMRALRFLPNKHAFIINTEDADRRSLCFNDCVENRGSEEGVSVEILSGEKTTQDIAKKVRSDEEFTIPQYVTVAGYEFEILRSVSSSNVDGAFYKAYFESSYRKFTSLGYESIRELMNKMTTNPENEDLVSDFLELVYPWFTLTSERIKRQFFSTSGSDLIGADEVSLDTLIQTMDKVRAGSILTWRQFNARFQTSLRPKFLSLQKKIQKLNFESLYSELIDPEYAQDEFEHFILDRADFNGSAVTTIDKSNLVPAYENPDCLDDLDNLKLRKDLIRVLKSLSYTEREIIKLRFGLPYGYYYSLEEISHVFKKTPERVRQIQARAITKLQQPSRSIVLLKYADFDERSEKFLQDDSEKITGVEVKKSKEEGRDLSKIIMLSESNEIRKRVSEIIDAQSLISNILFDSKKQSFGYVKSLLNVTESQLAGLTRSLIIEDIEASLKSHTISKIIAYKKELRLVDSDSIDLIRAEITIYRLYRYLCSLNVVQTLLNF